MAVFKHAQLNRNQRDVYKDWLGQGSPRETADSENCHFAGTVQYLFEAETNKLLLENAKMHKSVLNRLLENREIRKAGGCLSQDMLRM